MEFAGWWVHDLLMIRYVFIYYFLFFWRLGFSTFDSPNCHNDNGVKLVSCERDSNRQLGWDPLGLGSFCQFALFDHFNFWNERSLRWIIERFHIDWADRLFWLNWPPVCCSAALQSCFDVFSQNVIVEHMSHAPQQHRFKTRPYIVDSVRKLCAKRSKQLWPHFSSQINIWASRKCSIT